MFMIIIAPKECGFFCWHCGLFFTSIAKDDGYHCPQCSSLIAVLSSPFWPRGQAWCPTCKFNYGIVEVKGVEPKCPRCHCLPNGILPVSAIITSMTWAQLLEIKRLAVWCQENLPNLLSRQIDTISIARYFLDTAEVPQLTLETVEKYIQSQLPEGVNQ